ncbi:MAG: magnesium transporter [Proteobacteria bacterium]|nr:magnesium transporter [Pseudomonadota bacterium]
MPQDRQQLLVTSLRRFVRRGANDHVRRLVEKARAEDVAAALSELMYREARSVFELTLIDPVSAAGIVAAYESDLTELIGGLTGEQLVPVFAELAPDDAADILQELDEDLRAAILDGIADEEQEVVEELMQYAEDSAGGIMSPDFFALDKELTAREAIVALQENEDAESAFYVYCVNEEGTLVGVLSLRQLLMRPPHTQLKDMMVSDVISVPVSQDQEDVARIVAKYDLIALPVTDEFNKLVGIITVDDVIDVLRDEATEDMMLMAGVGDEDVALASTIGAVRTRLPWLLAAAGGGLGAAVMIGFFEGELKMRAQLAAFIPIVMGLGGNIGVQASTIVVRGIAMGQLEAGKFLSALWHELKVVAIIAVICSTLVAGLSLTMSGAAVDMAGAVATSLLVVMTLGALLGTAVPMLSHRFGIDPAVATGPILTTAIDLFGVLIYFLIAKAWLGI